MKFCCEMVFENPDSTKIDKFTLKSFRKYSNAAQTYSLLFDWIYDIGWIVVKLSRTYSKKIRILYRLNSCNENSGKKLKSILTRFN